MSRYEGHYDYEMRAICMILAICVALGVFRTKNLD